MTHRILRTFSLFLAAILSVSAGMAQTACSIGYTITNHWPGGFGAALTINNTGTTAISNWSLTWSFANGQTITQLWSGNATQSGSNVTVTNLSYDGSIPAGGSLTSVGFNGTWNNTTNAVPASFALNGVACSGGSGTGAGSFTLSSSVSSVSAAQGASATDTISVADTGGFTGAVTLAASGLPSGVTATFGTNPATGTSIVTFAAGSSAAAGTSTVTITGTSGTLTASTKITLVVGAAPSFTLTPSTTATSVGLGSSATDTISVTDVGGFTGAVTLALTGLPSGVTATFGTNPTTGSSVVTFAASSSATAETSTVTVTGTSGSLTASTTISLTVTAAPSFTLKPSPTSLIVPQGSSGTVTICVTDLGGFNGTVTLAVSGLPSGVAATIAPTSTAGCFVLTFTASSTATAGATTVTITGTSGTLTASTTIAFTVSSPQSFTLAASLASISIAQGSSATDTIAVTDAGGFTGAVTLAASGLPSGVTAIFGTNPTTGTSVVTFTTSSAVAAGSSTVTITGTSGTLTASTTIPLMVTSSTPTGGCKVTYTISPQSASAFGAALTITNTGSTAWTSWTLTWTFANGQTIASLWNGIESQSGANVTITNESYNGSIAAGSSYSSVGFNGTWNGVTNAVPTNFAVNGTTCSGGAASGFTLTSSAPTVSVSQGASTTDTISVTDLNGFSGSVTLAASGLPSGVTAAFSPSSTTGSSTLTLTASASVLAATSTVTITGTSGSLTATSTISLTVAGSSIVTVNQSSTGPAVTDQILGVNMAAWYDLLTNETGILDGFQTAGIKAVRWPGGSWSDLYHWQTNTNCQNPPNGGGTPAPNDVFENFVSDLAIPAGLDVALTADYGTNPACNGGGEPSEAAAWVTAALADGITVSHMTVGNEEYGNWEEDLHSTANDPTIYAAAVAGTGGYYDAIKAASPSTLVGVELCGGPNNCPSYNSNWDSTVLTNAKGFYDFVEYHYYPETPGEENDTTLIQQDAQQLTTDINVIKAELAAAGEPNTPIYVGEIGGPYSNPGKQSWSITQGLYAGQVLGEMMNDGVSRLTWWIGFGNCNAQAGNLSASLYGWQDFGAYNIFSDGPDDPTGDCPGAGAIGTLSPTAVAFQLFSEVAVNGETVLPASVTGDTTDVVAYAATHSGGTALVLFNRNETTSEPVTITLSEQTTASSVTVEIYDKAIYDLSGSPSGTFPDPAGTNTWAPPTTTTISSPTLPLSLTLAPWSINVVIIP